MVKKTTRKSIQIVKGEKKVNIIYLPDGVHKSNHETERV